MALSQSQFKVSQTPTRISQEVVLRFLFYDCAQIFAKWRMIRWALYSSVSKLKPSRSTVISI